MDSEQVEKWKKIIADQEASGISAGRWCEANNVKINRFYYWRNAIYGPKRVSVSKSEFVELKNPTVFSHTDSEKTEAVLEYGGYSLKIMHAMSEETLAKIIRVTHHA